MRKGSFLPLTTKSIKRLYQKLLRLNLRMYWLVTLFKLCFPVELGKLSNLEYLSFRNNQLSGTIPVELSKLTKLIDLKLGFNQLMGNIPLELSTLIN